MIDQLIHLGKILEKSWDIDNFPQDATDSLSTFEIKVSLSEFQNSISAWLLSPEKIPTQINLYNVFGEPSLTLFNNDKFAIDIYFWRKNDTLIHSHGFRGAFKVLFGQSLHEKFQVNTLEQVKDDLIHSSLKQSKLEILSKGDIRTISPGTALTHRILHLENPTVTLCIRTVNDIDLQQWHHLSSGVSYRQRYLKQKTVKQILYFQYLFASDPDAAITLLIEIFHSLDTSSQLSLYEGLFRNEFGLDDEVTEMAINTLRTIFLNNEWFHLYEQHYEDLSTHLLEYEVRKAPLKILAHAINCNYPPEKTYELLSNLQVQNISSLYQSLLSEKNVFTEEHFELQVERINKYSRLLLDFK